MVVAHRMLDQVTRLCTPRKVFISKYHVSSCCLHDWCRSSNANLLREKKQATLFSRTSDVAASTSFTQLTSTQRRRRLWRGSAITGPPLISAQLPLIGQLPESMHTAK
jgi:hypothetical protein